MKRKTLLSIAFLIALGVSIPNLQSYPTGAPADGRTGSPGDGGKTCYSGGCHFGVPSDATGIISSNVPAEGYTPGNSYTVTVTVDGASKKGFCVSPQAIDGTQMGTLTAGAGNSVSGKYVTHTGFKTTNPAVWTFTWVAPAKGSGAVDFYGAFVNSTSTTRKSKISITEKVAAGINENAALTRLSIYPNPAVSRVINLGFDLKVASNIRISLLDMQGKEVSLLQQSFQNAGAFSNSYDLPSLNSGIYFIRIEANDEVLNHKLLVQQN